MGYSEVSGPATRMKTISLRLPASLRVACRQESDPCRVLVCSSESLRHWRCTRNRTFGLATLTASPLTATRHRLAGAALHPAGFTEHSLNQTQVAKTGRGIRLRSTAPTRSVNSMKAEGARRDRTRLR